MNIKRMTADTGVQFTAKAEGSWQVFAPNKEAMSEANEIIAVLLADEDKIPDFAMGGIYPVKIVEVKSRGILVELHPGIDPIMIPMSQLTAQRVRFNFLKHI